MAFWASKQFCSPLIFQPLDVCGVCWRCGSGSQVDKITIFVTCLAWFIRYASSHLILLLGTTFPSQPKLGKDEGSIWHVNIFRYRCQEIPMPLLSPRRQSASKTCALCGRLLTSQQQRATTIFWIGALVVWQDQLWARKDKAASEAADALLFVSTFRNLIWKPWLPLGRLAICI